jgi:hypothetical protein
MAYTRLSNADWERIMSRAAPAWELGGVDWSDAIEQAQSVLPKSLHRGHAAIKTTVRHGVHLPHYEAWKAAHDRISAEINGTPFADEPKVSRRSVKWGDDEFDRLLPAVDRLLNEGYALSGAVIAAQETALPEAQRRTRGAIYQASAGFAEQFKAARKRAAKAPAPAPTPAPAPIAAPAPVAAVAAPIAAAAAEPAVAPAPTQGVETTSAVAATPPAPAPVAVAPPLRDVVPPFSPRAMDLAAALDAVLKDHAREQAAAHLQQLQHERAVLAKAIGEAILGRMGEVMHDVITKLLGEPSPAAQPEPSGPVAAPPPAPPPAPQSDFAARPKLHVDVIGLKTGFLHGEIQQQLNGLGDATDVRYIDFRKVGRTTMREIVIVVGEAPSALLRDIERGNSRLVRVGMSAGRVVEAIRNLHASH